MDWLVRPPTKPSQLRVRVADADMPIIEDLAGRVLTPPAVAAMLIAAAIDAIRESKGNLPFPPRFVVDRSSPASRLNDKAK